MTSISVDVRSNKAGILAELLPAMINRAIRKQVKVTETDVKVNIVKYDYIDQGNALGSTRGEMIANNVGLVSVSAESEKGFPYPYVGNYGSVHQAPRPFFSEAEAKARAEFPDRVKREIERV